MKERTKGYFAGILTSAVLAGAVMAGGLVYAASRSESIQALYEDIKVYIDNAPIALTDATGATVEPFIYNGTTYLPVRGVSEALGLDVAWDDATKSVYLWDEMSADAALFLDSCPSFQSEWTTEYTKAEGKSFKMSGMQFSNGIVLGLPQFGETPAHTSHKLEGKYNTLTCTVGIMDGSDQMDSVVTFSVDGNAVKTVSIAANSEPVKVTVPVSGGSILKIERDRKAERIGIGNMTIE